MAAGELGRRVNEEEYRAYLREERAAFARVLERYGSRTPDRARAEALTAYPYEPPQAPYRDLVFHDEAWHWAMLHLHGERYWHDHPELLHAPREYEEQYEQQADRPNPSPPTP
ncbi:MULTISPECIES: hypothetical protein [Streptomyces]|uniref:hypothetical protein n=1 Tax=Streptomyces TaxID=1883 RepID=UPI0028867DB6|nr:hypothetical protein [Streptomyces sp. DSM 41859]MDT0424546.1 hypothetical protein [Streptomyces sp. DSM 41859]